MPLYTRSFYTPPNTHGLPSSPPLNSPLPPPSPPPGSGNLEAIHIIKKPGGALRESYLDEGYILDKKIGVGQVCGGGGWGAVPCANRTTDGGAGLRLARGRGRAGTGVAMRKGGMPAGFDRGERTREEESS